MHIMSILLRYAPPKRAIGAEFSAGHNSAREILRDFRKH